MKLCTSGWVEWHGRQFTFSHRWFSSLGKLKYSPMAMANNLLKIPTRLKKKGINKIITSGSVECYLIFSHHRFSWNILWWWAVKAFLMVNNLLIYLLWLNVKETLVIWFFLTTGFREIFSNGGQLKLAWWSITGDNGRLSATYITPTELLATYFIIAITNVVFSNFLCN